MGLWYTSQPPTCPPYHLALDLAHIFASIDNRILVSSHCICFCFLFWWSCSYGKPSALLSFIIQAHTCLLQFIWLLVRRNVVLFGSLCKVSSFDRGASSSSNFGLVTDDYFDTRRLLPPHRSLSLMSLFFFSNRRSAIKLFTLGQ